MSSFKIFSETLNNAVKTAAITDLSFDGSTQQLDTNARAPKPMSPSINSVVSNTCIAFISPACPSSALIAAANILEPLGGNLVSVSRRIIAESQLMSSQCWLMQCTLPNNTQSNAALEEVRELANQQPQALDVVVLLRPNPLDKHKTNDTTTLFPSIKLACFDMDSTLIKMEVIDELARHAGIGEQVSQITERAMRGELDFKQSFGARLGLLKGLNANVIDEIKNNLPIMEGATLLMQGLHARGVSTMIFSGGFDVFAERVAATLGMQSFYANTLKVQAGMLTGVVYPPVVDASLKHDLLQQHTHKLDLQASQTLAVGDGANDLEMLGAAGLGIAYHAKPIVRQQAQVAISNNDLSSILYLIENTI